MKVNTLLKVTTIVTSVLLVVTGFTMYFLLKSMNERADALELKEESKLLAIEFQSASDYLTNEVRAYTQFGEKEHYDNYWKEVNETKTRDRVVERLQELKIPSDMLELIEEATTYSNSLAALEEKAMAEVEKDNLVLARSIVYGPSYNAGKGFIAEPLNEFNQKLDKWSLNRVNKSEQDLQTSFIIMIVASLFVFISVTVTFILLFKKLRPLSRLTKMADRIASGDMNVEAINVKSRDEIAQLTKSFNTMSENLRNLLLTVKKVGENVAASSEELLASAEQTNFATQQVSTSIDEIATGSEVQVKQVQDSTAAIHEVSQGIQMIANTTLTVSKSSEEMTDKAKTGERNLVEAVGQMKTIEQNVTSTARSIRNLDARSKEIEKIVDAITDISSQTNLLALNAAIEAARAGEHGKGFAVVADEVRKLAEQSNQSANQITQLIQSIQSDTVLTVDQMNTVSDDVNNGVRIIEDTGKAFKEILESAQGVASQVQEVSAVSEQIAASTEQVTVSFSEVNRITENATAKTQTVAGLAEEQSASMEEITASAEALSKLAADLTKEISRFHF